MANMWVVLLVLLGVVSSPAQASCGLDHCPVVRSPEQPSADWRVQARMHFTTFKLKGFRGHFEETYLSVEYRGLKNAVFGASVPLVLLTVEGDTRFGLGNSIVYGEWRLNIQKASIGAGLQVELPWGSAGGVADTHWVFLPNMNAHIPFWRMFFMGSVGFSQSVGGAHDHGSHDHGATHIGEEFVFVNPHAASELTYRMALGAPLWNRRIQAMWMVNGQQVLVGEGEKTFVQTGPRVQLAVSEWVSVHLSGELPISRARRFNGRLVAGVFLDF